MSDDQNDDDAQKKKPPTPEEVAEYEREVRQLLKRRAPFDKHLEFLRDRLAEKEPDEDGGER